MKCDAWLRTASVQIPDAGASASEVAGMLRFIRVFVLIGGPAITVMAGIALYRSYKSKIRLMSEVEPLECVVEDFLISSYYRKHKRYYKITPVLRDISTGELYCTFGVYDTSAWPPWRRQRAIGSSSSCRKP